MPEPTPIPDKVELPDSFEKLVDSVDSSLESGESKKTSAPNPEEMAKEISAQATAPVSVETLAAKSDEELLKEFENLLNS